MWWEDLTRINKGLKGDEIQPQSGQMRCSLVHPWENAADRQGKLEQTWKRPRHCRVLRCISQWLEEADTASSSSSPEKVLVLHYLWPVTWIMSMIVLIAGVKWYVIHSISFLLMIQLRCCLEYEMQKSATSGLTLILYFCSALDSWV